jgi:hypothetical protein
MGKKSKKNPTKSTQRNVAGKPSTNPIGASLVAGSAGGSNAAATADSNATTAANTGYPSDGPSYSEEEVNAAFRTSSRSLQAKLDQLVDHIDRNDREGFVRNFVPFDLCEQDVVSYLQDLTIHQEAAGQWRNLASEIAAIAAGRGVRKIEGDQISRAIFFFEHPLLVGCDREVCFVRTNNQEWRAEG